MRSEGRPYIPLLSPVASREPMCPSSAEGTSRFSRPLEKLRGRWRCGNHSLVSIAPHRDVEEQKGEERPDGERRPHSCSSRAPGQMHWQAVSPHPEAPCFLRAVPPSIARPPPQKNQGSCKKLREKKAVSQPRPIISSTGFLFRSFARTCPPSKRSRERSTSKSHLHQ